MRNRTSARKAGATLERALADHLNEHVDDRIDRRVRTGAKDRGDLAAIRTAHGLRVVVEAKDYGGRILAGPWLREAELERGHDDAAVGLVVAKRRGVTYPGAQIVLMAVDDLIVLLTGRRPGVDAP